MPVRQGDRLIFSTAGAGGLGDPLDREPERVATDVRSGLVTAQAARTDYGVVVSATGTLDTDATTTARDEIRDTRQPRPDFDFGPLPAVDELRRQIADERRQFESALARETDPG